MRNRALAAVLATLVTGCSTVGTQPSSAAQAEPDPNMRPDLLVIEPAIAAPGDVVALTFPEETTRGIAFVLEQRVADGWETRFFMTSDGPGPGWEMSWHPQNAQGIAVEDIGVGGPGPDHVPIPEVAEPGDYRICTANALDDFCAPIQVVAP